MATFSLEYTQKLQINVTKENCDYYIEITAGPEHINVWLRKKNTFDYWTIEHPSEESKLDFDIIEKYILDNFDSIVKALTGDEVPDGTATSEEIVSAITGPDEDGCYVDVLKEYTVFGYIFWGWMCKIGTTIRRPAGSGSYCNFAYEISDYEFNSMKERYIKENQTYEK